MYLHSIDKPCLDVEVLTKIRKIVLGNEYFCIFQSVLFDTNGQLKNTKTVTSHQCMNLLLMPAYCLYRSSSQVSPSLAVERVNIAYQLHSRNFYTNASKIPVTQVLLSRVSDRWPFMRQQTYSDRTPNGIGQLPRHCMYQNTIGPIPQGVLLLATQNIGTPERLNQVAMVRAAKHSAIITSQLMKRVRWLA